jgi:1-acyl-sn-glycerol-3-phosphate acyltransferase
MTGVCSLVFAILACLWTGGLLVIGLPLLLLPRRFLQGLARLWTRGLLTLLDLICGLKYRIAGREHLPTGPVIIAANHQSAWDTLVFHTFLPDPVFVLKRELLRVPFFGWYLARAGNIAIDRRAGFRALKRLLPQARRRLEEGAQIIVFPEGVRAAPGELLPFQPGIAALYRAAAVPVVPAALNSGFFWRRRGFMKHRGLITLEFLAPLPSGLDRDAFMTALAERIGGAAARLGATAPQPAAKDGGNTG